MTGQTSATLLIEPPTVVESTSSSQIVSGGDFRTSGSFWHLGHSVALAAAAFALTIQAPSARETTGASGEYREGFVSFTGGEDPALRTPFLRWPSRHYSIPPEIGAEDRDANPAAPVATAIRWLREAGIPKTRLATLLNVSRPTLDAWEAGTVAPHDANRQRILALRDILERATIRMPAGWTLADWLDTPRGSDGVTPGALLRAGDFGRARLLAMSTPSPGLTGLGSRVIPQIAPRFRHLVEPRQSPRGAEPTGESPLEDSSEAE